MGCGIVAGRREGHENWRGDTVGREHGRRCGENSCQLVVRTTNSHEDKVRIILVPAGPEQAASPSTLLCASTALRH